VFKSKSLLLLSQEVHEIQFGALRSLDQSGGNEDTNSTKHITDSIYDTQKNNFHMEVCRYAHAVVWQHARSSNSK